MLAHLLGDVEGQEFDRAEVVEVDLANADSLLAQLVLAWMFVTSQEDMDKVVGDRTRQQGNDLPRSHTAARRTPLGPPVQTGDEPA
jgi:hypothetical protein